MKTENELEITRRYYSIGDVAEIIGQNPSVLRFWEKEFGELYTRKSSGGRRQYTSEDVELIKTIHHLLKEKKFTIEGAREHLKKHRTETGNLLKTRETLKNLKNLLTYIREKL
jgi:DNA-binding transcriptional MerR regulator